MCIFFGLRYPSFFLKSEYSQATPYSRAQAEPIAFRRCASFSGLIVSGANLTPKAIVLRYRVLFRLMYLLKREQKVYMMMTEPQIVPEDLKTIRVPTLVLAGEKDLIYEKETKRIAASIPDANLIILPGESHGTYIIHQTKIADLILEETRKQQKE